MKQDQIELVAIVDYSQLPLKFKIDEVLTRRGITRWGLAERLGINLQYVVRYCENKIQRPDMVTVQRMAEILQVRYSDLIEIQE
jgi:transcriptional regulator with XRE-family HTH domain